MPFDCHPLAGTPYVLSRLHGNVELADCLNLVYSLTRDHETLDGIRVLCDVRDAVVRLSVGDLFNLTSFIRAYHREFARMKWANIANDHLAYGLARSAGLMVRDLPIDYATFRSVDDACCWLGLPLELFENPPDVMSGKPSADAD